MLDIFKDIIAEIHIAQLSPKKHVLMWNLCWFVPIHTAD